jgi:hypothetical protein
MHGAHLQLSTLLCHLQRTLESSVTTNEAASVDKDGARNARNLAQILIPNTAPRLRQSLPVLKATRLQTHSANAPLAVCLAALGEQSVQHAAFGVVLLFQVVQVLHPGDAFGAVRDDDDAALGVVLRAVGEGLLDDFAGGEPGVGLVEELGDELLADEVAGFEEAGVFFVLGLLRGRGGSIGADAGFGGVAGSGGGVVEAVDDAGHAEALVGEALLDASVAESGGVVDGDAVVVGVESLDEVGVELVVEEVVVGLGSGQAGDGFNDLLAVVHPDEAGAAQLGRAAGEDGVELALVVVVALCIVVVDAADVADDVAGLEGVGVTGADERAVGVLGEETEEVDGQGLVGVEVAVVGANDGRVCSVGR